MGLPSTNRRIGRTRYLVPDPSFYWYVRIMTTGALLVGAVFGGLLWWYHGKLLDLLGLYDMLDQPGVQGMLVEYSKLSLAVTTLTALGSTAFVIMIGVFLLHRIAGPIYRLKTHMLGIVAGEAPRPLRFRDDDQLRDLADLFNDMMRHLGHLESAPAAAREQAAGEPEQTGADALGAAGKRVAVAPSSGR
jgi:methyl-accepting chemotaxis protein